MELFVQVCIVCALFEQCVHCAMKILSVNHCCRRHNYVTVVSVKPSSEMKWLSVILFHVLPGL